MPIGALNLGRRMANEASTQAGSGILKSPATSTQWESSAGASQPRQVSGDFSAIKQIHEKSAPSQPFNFARNDRTGKTVSQFSPTVIKPSGRDPDAVQAELTADYNRKQQARRAQSSPATSLVNMAAKNRAPAQPASEKLPAVPPPAPPQYTASSPLLDSSFGAVNPETAKQINTETDIKRREGWEQFNRDRAAAESSRRLSDANRQKEINAGRERHDWGKLTEKERWEAVRSGAVKPPTGLPMAKPMSPTANAEMERLKQRDLSIAQRQETDNRRIAEEVDSDRARRMNLRQARTGQQPDVQTRLQMALNARKSTGALAEAAKPRSMDREQSLNPYSLRTGGGRIRETQKRQESVEITPEALAFQKRYPEKWLRMTGKLPSTDAAIPTEAAQVRQRAEEHPQLSEQLQAQHQPQIGKWWKDNVWSPMTDWDYAVSTEGRRSMLPMPRSARRAAQNIGNFWEAPVRGIGDQLMTETSAPVPKTTAARDLGRQAAGQASQPELSPRERWKQEHPGG